MCKFRVTIRPAFVGAIPEGRISASSAAVPLGSRREAHHHAFPESLKQGVVTGLNSLEDKALLLLLLPGGESSTSSMLKDFPDALVGLGRALDVLLGADLVLDLSCLQAC